MDNYEQDPPEHQTAIPAGATPRAAGLTLIEGAAEPARPAGADTVTASQARRIAQAFSHAAKSCRLYPPENRLRLRFTEELIEALGDALASAPAVNFLVRKKHLEFGGEIVVEQENQEEIVPGRLYWSGLRHLSFHTGISPEETREFLEILVLADLRRDAGDEDLTTLLWSRHFPHIRHLAIDDLVEREEMFDPFEVPDELIGAAIAETDAGAAESSSPATARHAVESALDEVRAGLGAGADEALFDVSAADLEALRTELKPAVDGPDQRPRFLRIVRETLALEPDERALVDLVEIIRAALVAFLHQGDFAFATELTELLRDRRDRTPVPPPGACRALDRALALELEESGLHAWVQQLDDPQSGALDALPRLMKVLAPEAIPILCEILGRLQTSRARRRLIDLLAAKGRDQVALFAPGMHDRRWYLVRNVALILEQIGNPASAELLRPAVQHTDVRVRKQALAAMARLGGSTAMLLLSNALADPDPGLRLWAAQALAGNGPRALPRLSAILESKEFERRDLPERAAFYEAYAYAGRAEAVAYLRKLVEQKSLLKPRYPEPVRACLCRALGVAGGTEAKAVLEKLQADRSTPVRDAARAALSLMAAGAPAPLDKRGDAP